MRRLLVALVVFTFFTMVLGAWTRVANAGLACPDWPLCHGKIIPPLTYQIMLEYFHRLAASLVSITLCVVSFLILKSKSYRMRFGKLLLLAWLLLLSQIIFGGLTVLKLLKGEIVATHLTLGFSFFGVLLFTTLRVHKTTAPAPFKFSYVHLCLIALLIQVILGGIVSSHYAGLACPDFPTCQGLWFPGFEGNVGLHFVHRCGAIVLTMLLLRLMYRLMGQGEAGTLLGTLLLLLIVFQWCLGITMIFLQLPHVMAVAHLATAILIFALLLVVNDQESGRRLSQSN